MTSFMQANDEAEDRRKIDSAELERLRKDVDSWKRECLRLRDELADKWLPFASAPKDHTSILAWREDSGVIAVHWAPPGGEYRDVSECDDENNDWGWFTLGEEDLTGDLPSLWQPFPSGPTAAQAAKGKPDE